LALKYKVQSLLDSGLLTFQEDKPNVESNPLLGYASASTNAVMKWEGDRVLRDVRRFRNSIKFVFEALC